MIDLFSILVVVALLSVFSRWLWPKLRRGRATAARGIPNLPSDLEAAYLVCAFSMLGKLAQADGVVSEEEVDKVTQYIDGTLNLDAKKKALALKMFHQGAASPLEFRDYAEQFGREFKDRVNLTGKLLTVLLEVSAADGVLSKEEDELIYSASLLLGFSRQGFSRLKKKLELEVPTVH